MRTETRAQKLFHGIVYAPLPLFVHRYSTLPRTEQQAGVVCSPFLAAHFLHAVHVLMHSRHVISKRTNAKLENKHHVTPLATEEPPHTTRVTA
jgi:hypothetical protein